MRKRKEEARARKRERERERERGERERESLLEFVTQKTYCTIDTAKMRGGFPAIFFLSHPQTGNFAIRGARQTTKREQVLSGLTRNRG